MQMFGGGWRNFVQDNRLGAPRYLPVPADVEPEEAYDDVAHRSSQHRALASSFQHKGLMEPLVVFCVFTFGSFAIRTVWGTGGMATLEKRREKPMFTVAN